MTQGLNRILWSTFGLLLAALWGLPFIYSVWTAFHDEIYSANFVWNAPLTLENFTEAWQSARFSMVVVLAGGLAGLIAILIFMEVQVLRSVGTVSRFVAEVRQTHDLGKPGRRVEANSIERARVVPCPR